MSPDLELFVQEEVASGRFADREAYIAYAVRMQKLEREDTLAGIRKGLEEADAGLGQPLDEAFADIRRSLNLPATK
jgi:predicted transcriptional regulator